MPRCTKPVPFGGWPSSYGFGSNDQISRPVSAFSATTLLYGVVKYSVSSIISGVASNTPGRVPKRSNAFSPVFHSHATVKRDTFDRLMSVSGEYFDPP